MSNSLKSFPRGHLPTTYETNAIEIADDSFPVCSMDLAQEIEIWSHVNGSWPVDTPPPDLGDAYYSKGEPHTSLLPVSDDEPPLVAVVGVGYIGIKLVTAFSAHFDVIAFDTSEKRLKDIAPELDQYPSVVLTSAAADIACATHFLIAVPTSLRPDRRIDLTHLQRAIYSVGLWARPGATVVVESSVAVGMTRSLIGLMMRIRGLKAGMSPERVDPGHLNPAFEAIPKIISGLDEVMPGSLDSIDKLYSKVFKTIVKVSKPEVAEMTNLYENCQRMVGIAYANEMADSCVAHGIDALEVCSAAATKPFGYMHYAPGLGVGGHCIPVNPHYLLSNCDFRILQAATEKMRSRPNRLGDLLVEGFLYSRCKEEAWSRRLRILVVGVAFKRGESNISHSPAVTLIQHLLDRWEAEVTFADPLVAEEALPYVPRLDEKTEWNKECLDSFDIIIVAIEQVGLDFTTLDNLADVEVVSYTS